VISEYLAAALRTARYEILPDDGSYYGQIQGFDGVYANASTLEECREELREILEKWILFRVSRNLSLPVVVRSPNPHQADRPGPALPNPAPGRRRA